MATEALRLLTRRRCHLCELVRGPLAEITGGIGLPLVELDIDEHPDLRQTYSERIPVLLWHGLVVAEGRFDPQSVVNSLRLPPANQ